MGKEARSWAVEQRIAWIKEMVEIFGFINREHIMKKFWVSTAQASVDIQLAQKRFPNLMAYNTQQKQYILKG